MRINFGMPWPHLQLAFWCFHMGPPFPRKTGQPSNASSMAEETFWFSGKGHLVPPIAMVPAGIFATDSVRFIRPLRTGLWTGWDKLRR